MTEERGQSTVFGLLARDLMRSGASFRFCARGRSMWPTIRDGDTLHVEPVGKAPSLGDVVLFLQNGRFTVHRIVGRRDGNFITRGDASMEADGVLRSEEILGRVVAKACAATGRTVRINCTREKLLFLVGKIRGNISRFVRASIAGSCSAAMLLVPISLWAQGGVALDGAPQVRTGTVSCASSCSQSFAKHHH